MQATGYCWPQSGFPGDAIALYASAPGPVDVEVVRDSGPAEVVWRAEGIAGMPREVPTTVVEDGCRWPVAVTIPTDANWPSGMYLVRLHRAGERHADPSPRGSSLRARRPAPSGCILVLATNTWNAYNDFGGRNLYTGATAVSFERPLTNGMLEKPTEPGERLVDGGREYIEYTARARAEHVARHGGVGRPGASLRQLGRARRHRARLRDEPRPRGRSRPARRLPAVPQRRTRRVLELGDARHRRTLRRVPAATPRSSPATRATGRFAPPAAA